MVVVYGLKVEAMDEDLLLPTLSPHQSTDPLQLLDLPESANPLEHQDGMMEHVCGECGKACENRAKLKAHKKYHEREKNLKCDWPDCAKAFYARSLLEAHRLTHTEEKPFACSEPECTKAFRTKGELKSHNLVHTGQKSHKCSECGKSFSRK